jgi:hypothetical protein
MRTATGRSRTPAGPPARRTYNAAGTYTVTTKVPDDREATETALERLSITDAPPPLLPQHRRWSAT